MRDKHSTGQVDPSKDHHMIGGVLVPAVERSPNRVQKSKATKRNRGEKSGKGAEAASKPNA